MHYWIKERKFALAHKILVHYLSYVPVMLGADVARGRKATHLGKIVYDPKSKRNLKLRDAKDFRIQPLAIHRDQFQGTGNDDHCECHWTAFFGVKMRTKAKGAKKGLELALELTTDVASTYASQIPPGFGGDNPNAITRVLSNAATKVQKIGMSPQKLGSLKHASEEKKRLRKIEQNTAENDFLRTTDFAVHLTTVERTVKTYVNKEAAVMRRARVHVGAWNPGHSHANNHRLIGTERGPLQTWSIDLSYHIDSNGSPLNLTNDRGLNIGGFANPSNYFNYMKPGDSIGDQFLANSTNLSY